MARAVITAKPERRPAHEPLYEIDPKTGASVEIFYCDRVLAESFGVPGAGWFHWWCQPGRLPECPPTGPFPTSYAAYRNALRGDKAIQFGRRIATCSTKP
jgi:hypothetical protein